MKIIKVISIIIIATILVVSLWLFYLSIPPVKINRLTVGEHKLMIQKLLSSIKAGNKIIKLKDITPFEWTDVCYIGGYESYKNGSINNERLYKLKSILGEEGIKLIDYSNYYEKGKLLFLNSHNNKFWEVEDYLWIFKYKNKDYIDSDIYLEYLSLADKPYDIKFKKHKTPNSNHCYSENDSEIIVN